MKTKTKNPSPKKIKPRSKSEGKIAHKINTIDNIKFQSKIEGNYYLKLKEDKAKKRIKSFELQPEFLLQDKFIIVNGKKINGSDKNFDKIKKESKAPTIQSIKYIADFKVVHNDNTIEIIDIKGIKTADFKLKEKMFKYKYPELDFKCIVYYDKQWMEYKECEKLKKEKKKNKQKE